MKLLSWNIQHGGGTRDVRIVSAIAGHNPDLIALSEFRARPGMALCQAFGANGWPHIVSSSPTGIDNGICVLSRTPVSNGRPNPAPPENAVRWLDVDLPEQGFGIAVMHIITALPGAKDPEGAAKTRFWDALLTFAEEHAGKPLLILGDLNTGIHGVDEAGATFLCAEHFARLSALGWVDVWRHFHGDASEYTWYSLPRAGVPPAGFRLDHAFATQSLLPRIKECRYSHDEREQKVSDHSVLLLEIK
ncbi:MAG: endonuclease/exonuclease/phosphatase family protein [Candidatus Solibacter sp.]